MNKLGFVTVDTNRYGLSPELAGKIVQAKIYFDKIEVYYDHCLLKSFRRSYEKNSENSDWKDYLSALVKKPGAAEYTRFFNQMPKLWQAYLKNTTGKEKKSALLLLSEIVKDGKWRCVMMRWNCVVRMKDRQRQHQSMLSVHF